MKLGLMLGYSGSRLNIPIPLIQRAEEVGFDSVWSAEAYGSDAITPLAYIAAHTSKIRLGTGIMQLAGRAPAMAAMQAQTVDALAGGDRVIAGLGVSGPQIVEGWYGQPWGKPVHRLRDYIEIMKKIFAREEPVVHDGREYQLPYQGEGALGIGKPLKSIMHTNADLPIWLGSVSPLTVRLTAELCDGWFPMHFVPGRMREFQENLDIGFERAGNGKSMKDLEIQPMISVNLTDDVQKAIDAQKPGIALYAGGMGAKDMNFHNDHMVARGYGEAAALVQELYLAGRKEEAAAAIPDEMVDEAALIGPPERIRKRYAEWADSGITGLTITTHNPQVVDLMADVADVPPA